MCMSGAMYASMNGPPPGASPRRATSAAPGSGPPGRSRRCSGADERRVLLVADVLAHLDRRGGVVRAVVEVAVVLQAEVDPVGDAVVGGALAGEVELLARQRDAGDVHAVARAAAWMLSDPQPQPTSSRRMPGASAELAADEVELGALGVGER